MADDPDDAEVSAPFRYLFAAGGTAAIVFPALAAINGLVLDGQLTSLQVALGSILSGVPVGLEFVFSERDPYVIGRYVGVFVVLLVLLGVGQGVAALLLGRDGFPPAVEALTLLAAYAGAYLLLARGVVDRLATDDRPGGDADG